MRTHPQSLRGLGHISACVASAAFLMTAVGCGQTKLGSATPLAKPVEPPPVGGFCSPLTTANQSAVLGLGATFACAGCHYTGLPDGLTDDWGPDNDLTDAGWNLAFRSLEERKEGRLVEVLNGAITDGAHAANAPAVVAMGTWLETFRDSDCAPIAVAVCPEAETETVVSTQALADTFVCARCHYGGGASLRDRQWGASDDRTPAGWNLAFRGLAEVAPERLIASLNGGIADGNHPENAAAATGMQVWVDTYQNADCADVAPGPDPTPEPTPDPEPELDCFDPWPETQREADFGANLTAKFVACSGCHRGAANNGAGISFDGTTAYTTAIALIDSESPTESTIGRLLRVTGSEALPNHNIAFAGLDDVVQGQTDEWVGLATAGVPVDSPECNVELCPITPIESEALFDADLLTDFIGCSSCHRAGPSPTNGNLQFTAADAYDVAVARIEPGIAPAATTIGLIMGVDGAVFPGHGFNFPPAVEGKAWIRGNLDGIPCAP